MNEPLIPPTPTGKTFKPAGQIRLRRWDERGRLWWSDASTNMWVNVKAGDLLVMLEEPGVFMHYNESGDNNVKACNEEHICKHT